MEKFTRELGEKRTPEEKIAYLLKTQSDLLTVQKELCRDNIFLSISKDDDIKMAKCMLTSGYDLNFKDKNGLSPLHIVKSVEMAEFLIENGANVNAKTKRGASVLQIVTSRNFTEIIKLLLKHGAIVEFEDMLQAITTDILVKLGMSCGENERVSANEILKHMKNVYDTQNCDLPSTKIMIEHLGNNDLFNDIYGEVLNTVSEEGLKDGINNGHICSKCKLVWFNKLNTCAGCRNVFYCNEKCQRLDWTEHKQICKKS